LTGVAYGYVRGSKDEQEATLKAQTVRIIAAAEVAGRPVQRVVVDQGESGKDLDRPGLNDLRARLEDGDILYVAISDRLTRSVEDWLLLVKESRAGGWAIVLLDMDVDTTTPWGWLAVMNRIVYAEFERQMISWRTKQAMAVKAAEGVQIGRPPELSDEAHEAIIRLASDGCTLGSIARSLKELGIASPRGGEWSKNTIRRCIARDARERSFATACSSG
jgi:DNA invertase Pin-like site-specific DNA recombinase